MLARERAALRSTCVAVLGAAPKSAAAFDKTGAAQDAVANPIMIALAIAVATGCFVTFFIVKSFECVRGFRLRNVADRWVAAAVSRLCGGLGWNLKPVMARLHPSAGASTFRLSVPKACRHFDAYSELATHAYLYKVRFELFRSPSRDIAPVVRIALGRNALRHVGFAAIVEA